MKMNVAIWIGIVGGVVGFAGGIMAVWIAGGPEAIYVTAGMIAVFGFIIFLFYKLMIGPMLLNTRLKKIGVPGKAKILEVHDTGVTINNNPQVKLVLEVKNNLGQIYHASCRVMVSRINPGIFQPGMEVGVKIDPNNEQKLIIDN